MTDSRLPVDELEAFLAVARELHFGRAASSLRLSQPRTSQLIRSLERRVGGALFERTSRRVTLTPLGLRLRELTEPSIGELRAGLEQVRALAHGLRVGFMGPFSSTAERVLGAFRARHPDCAVTLSEIHWTDLYGPLRRSEIDLQVSLWPVEQPDLTASPEIAQYPRVLAITRRHPLAARPQLDLEDLAGIPIIQPLDEIPAEIKRTFWPPPASPTGRPIPQGPVCHTQQEMLSLVAQGIAACVTSAIVPSHYAHPEVAFVPLTGMPPVRAVLCWRTGTMNSRILQFAESARPLQARPAALAGPARHQPDPA